MQLTISFGVKISVGGTVAVLNWCNSCTNLVLKVGDRLAELNLHCNFNQSELWISPRVQF